MGTSTITCIMLIDDDKNDNFFHERAIRKYNPDIKIITYLSAEEALRHLAGTENAPDVIFLDINMPGMNGWEFLEEYHNLTKGRQKSLIITMLSTSENPDDMERAGKKGVFFKSKPLTIDMLQETEGHYSNFGEMP
jgi:CheY-like chemotaxis protein